ncbi:MAG: M23 family metallopeptidase [Prevotella sp.]|jgi:murein DD-endopeptidase|nr:M23 family metallopeptidase [Prevotella sp.]
MKSYKVLLFAISLLTANTAFAQFNTVSQDVPRYKVSVKSASVPTPRLPDAPLASTNTNSNSLQAGQQKKQIDLRLSVAYPLKHIQVTSPFGYRRDPFTGKKRMHNGLDLHARSDKVFAMLYGIVHKVGYDKRSGIFVILRHGDITVSYCHLSKVAVRKGDVVSAGTVVGVTGNTGRSTGEHLHIICKLRGKHVDPMAILRFLVHYQK